MFPLSHVGHDRENGAFTALFVDGYYAGRRGCSLG